MMNFIVTDSGSRLMSLFDACPQVVVCSWFVAVVPLVTLASDVVCAPFDVVVPLLAPPLFALLGPLLVSDPELPVLPV